jgi:hypothetical protein
LYGASAPAPSASVSTHAPSAFAFALPVGSKLQTYLDSDHVCQFDDLFSILSWWHDHKRTYPVLSILVKDIMIVHVSTISSKSAFSLCGRVIEEHQRSLTSERVEMLSLLKDWDKGDTRQQHNIDDRALEEKMVNQFLDGHGPEGAAAVDVSV